MKKLIIGTALATALAAPALAADLPARAPIARAPVVAVPVAYNWSGFYVGLHGGGVWGDKEWTLSEVTGAGAVFGSAGDSDGHDLSGWLGGVQVGFNVQSGQWVFGIEADWSWSSAKGDFECVIFTCESKANWMGTVAGRLGIAFDRVLLYVKGGVAFVDDDYEISGTVPILLTSVSFKEGHTRTGWMVGGGLEFALAANWTGKVEYNYMDFGSKSVTFGDDTGSAVIDIEQKLHVVKFGLNYRFGGPVVARY